MSHQLLNRIALAFICEKAFNMKILNEQIVLHPVSLFPGFMTQGAPSPKPTIIIGARHMQLSEQEIQYIS